MGNLTEKQPPQSRLWRESVWILRTNFVMVPDDGQIGQVGEQISDERPYSGQLSINPFRILLVVNGHSRFSRLLGDHDIRKWVGSPPGEETHLREKGQPDLISLEIPLFKHGLECLQEGE